ncbi:hypothetical protein [Streptomyces sp. NBC_01408]|uniref:hypothetical protein n=1 Tax=Streptomyces sp. NBC_01408 TaxID=2903855 RepID=UPI00225649CD|nr:hypothetical protein [Streptomyces sp. NBC_01408]MCX4695657.1 hypothetical protein [Streptomyces sp. NBC_01408]
MSMTVVRGEPPLEVESVSGSTQLADTRNPIARPRRRVPVSMPEPGLLPGSDGPGALVVGRLMAAAKAPREFLEIRTLQLPALHIEPQATRTVGRRTDTTTPQHMTADGGTRYPGAPEPGHRTTSATQMRGRLAP